VSASPGLSAAEYRALVEHSPVLIWRAGLDTNCDYFNDTWLAFTGRTLAQEVGAGWAAGVHPDDVQRCVDYYLDHFRRRASFEMEYRLRRHDGVYRWILDRGVPFHDEAGTFAGFIGSCVDVHERRLAQDERAQELSGAREVEGWLLGIVGHDIRNPLGLVDLAAVAAQRAATDPAVVSKNLARIRRGADRIRHIVDDLLDVTRERRGGIPIVRAPIDLMDVCREVVEELEASPAASGRALQLSGSGDTTGSWDRHRLAQAISNLVGNALTHGTPGSSVSVSVAGDREGVAVEVRNAGVVEGIDPERLFEAYRVRDRKVGRKSGLGLGLFITRAIARAHGGDLTVESSTAEETTFRLRLPR
jgi:PAS domain S-box-containing protein